MKEVAFGRKGEAYKLDFAPQARMTSCYQIVSGRSSTQVRLILHGASQRAGRLLRAFIPGMKLAPLAFSA